MRSHHLEFQKSKQSIVQGILKTAKQLARSTGYTRNQRVPGYTHREINSILTRTKHLEVAINNASTKITYFNRHSELLRITNYCDAHAMESEKSF